MAQWPDLASRSRDLYERGLKVLPGGITRTLPWQEPFPVYASHGQGAYVVDVDGTRRLDLLNNFASLIHGHAHPGVVQAVRRQVGNGTAFTLPTEQEVALAETICARAELRTGAILQLWLGSRHERDQSRPRDHGPIQDRQGGRRLPRRL